jgi:hypothetical protein
MAAPAKTQEGNGLGEGPASTATTLKGSSTPASTGEGEPKLSRTKAFGDGLPTSTATALSDSTAARHAKRRRWSRESVSWRGGCPRKARERCRCPTTTESPRARPWRPPRSRFVEAAIRSRFPDRGLQHRRSLAHRFVTTRNPSTRSSRLCRCFMKGSQFA